MLEYSINLGFMGPTMRNDAESLEISPLPLIDPAIRGIIGPTQVLIVDDEEPILEELGEYLRHKGLDIVTANSANQALTVYRSNHKIGVILLDVRMPGRDGLEFLSILQQYNDPERPLPQVVVITGHAGLNEAVRALRLGAVDFLSKPLDLRDLHSAIRNALLKRARETMDAVARAELIRDVKQTESDRLRMAEIASQLRAKLSSDIYSASSSIQRLTQGLLSSEIRRPLREIIAAASASDDSDGGPLTIIRQNAAQAIEAIDTLADISAAETKSLLIKITDVNVAGLLARVGEIFGPVAEKHNVTLQIECPPNLPRLRADELRLAQAVAQLISNAIQWSPVSGTVRLVACQRGDAVDITVQDSGPGIPEQVNLRSTKRLNELLPLRDDCAGLGLVLARRMAEIQGGQLHFKTGAGTYATITMPLSRKTQVVGRANVSDREVS